MHCVDYLYAQIPAVLLYAAVQQQYYCTVYATPEVPNYRYSIL